MAMSGQIHLRFAVYDLRLRAERQSMKSSDSALRESLKPAVIVGALGYFVDVYDLILFSIVRRASLLDLGVPDSRILEQGILLLNWQMAGMLVGGIIFGILGDRLGRVVLLFGSILLYSVANIANGFVHSVEAYAVWRFIAGVGLAGELGGGITLVTEVLSKEARGYGTMIVATIGVFGAVIGGLVADLVHWRNAYFIGGGLGLLLLVLRMSVAESGMFKQLRTSPGQVARGDFLSLFKQWDRFLKYLRCILIGLPLWFVIGILVSFSPEFAAALKIRGEVNVAHAVAFAYLGITFGGFASGFFSQQLRSRKQIIFAFVLFTLAAMVAYFLAAGVSSATLYLIILFLGFGVGYWTVFVTVAAEQFGTNIRATVATTVPNFIRGSVVPLTLAFNYLKSFKMGGEPVGVVTSAAIVGTICILTALWALRGLDETYGKELDYIEPI
jgi:putative MFS transporter